MYDKQIESMIEMNGYKQESFGILRLAEEVYDVYYLAK